MGKVKLKSYNIGIIGTNVYFVINTETNEAFIVDPADRADFLSSELKKMGLKLVAILLTHGHFDHISGVKGLVEEYKVPVYAHEEEQEVLQNVDLNSSTMYGKRFAVTLSADVLLKDGQEFDLAGIHIKALFTPGHTKGGVSYYLPEENMVFAGDTLFAGSVGRTDFPTGSMSQLVRGVEKNLFTLPDETIVYPGHMGSTTIGHEKKYNPFFR